MKEIEELYFQETGDKATYRKGSSDYHPLKYVHWLEHRFTELQKYKTAFEPLWDYCVEERKNKIALELKIAELEKEVENLNQEIIEMRGIYCSECGACGESGCCPPERCKELDTHLKCLYGIGYAKEYKELLDENNKLEKEVENLRCCANCFNLARTKNCPTDNWHENPRKSCDNWIFDGYKK